ncbi:type II toxin-antitoxin system VapC family toxin [Glycomyces arizonensis]|uniref:type II toxin-antitoxin system VapC family toxin n=1 Tax=Glycomyces arizonensis TaxID=256035 RepID=UPI000401F530|nr:type II toxin-antitoxin system VapC family toxin [Glycomyces arizonensis]
MPEAESQHEFGLLDTSVVIDYQELGDELLPRYRTISTVTLAELHAGPSAARNNALKQAQRQQMLNWAQRIFRNPLPFDEISAQTYGSVYLLIQESGRKPRKYVPDMMIAAIAIRNQLPFYTRNPRDFEPLESLLEICPV